MANLKPLKPSLKERKRFVVFELVSEKELSHSDIVSSINKVCLDFMGILHSGKAGVMVLRNQLLTVNTAKAAKTTKAAKAAKTDKSNAVRGIIKVNHKYVDYVKASLMMIKEINKTKANVNTVGVSGILKKAKDKFMKV